MDVNPYQSPAASRDAADDAIPDDLPIVGIRSGKREDLLRVVRLQRGAVNVLLVYAAVYALAGVLMLVGVDLGSRPIAFRQMPPAAQTALTVGLIVYYAAYLVVTLAPFVFVVLFSARFFRYWVVVSIVLGVLSLYPIAGFVVLLLLNFKARRVLRANGIPLGTLWARWPAN